MSVPSNGDVAADTPAKPAVLTSRIEIVDIVRGVALLGILLLNIPFFAMPEYFSESWRADTGNHNFWVNAVNVILFEGKMRALFSMVFGAGIILFTTGKEKAGKSATALFYKRMIWLAIFGLAHAHLMLWLGDILYFYGLIGMLAFLFRKMKPVYLAMGVPVVAIVGFVANTLFMQDMREKRLDYREAQTAREAGIPLTSEQDAALANWREIEKEFLPNKEEVAQHTALMKGGYAEVASFIRPKAFKGQTEYLIYSIWDMLALMMLGIALYKWGFLTMRWSKKHYLVTILVGYGIGLPMVIYSHAYNVIHFPTVEAFLTYLENNPINWVALLYDFQRIGIMMAHVSVIILVYQAGWLRRLMHSLKAVGQLAFTNYVMQTAICTLVFFGYGLNQFAQWEFYQLFYLVFAIWLFQLVISPIWLHYFLFGPLEWLWRCLTYWRIQPFLRKKQQPLPAQPTLVPNL